MHLVIQVYLLLDDIDGVSVENVLSDLAVVGDGESLLVLDQAYNEFVVEEFLVFSLYLPLEFLDLDVVLVSYGLRRAMMDTFFDSSSFSTTFTRMEPPTNELDSFPLCIIL